MPLSVAVEGPRKCKSQRLRAKNISPSERHKVCGMVVSMQSTMRMLTTYIFFMHL